MEKKYEDEYGNYIYTRINDNIMYIDKMFIDSTNENSFKYFICLLRSCANTCEQNNITTHRQLVLIEDWNIISHFGWTIVIDYGDTRLIECDINEMPKLIISGIIGQVPKDDY
jgi:hypothetical protein